MKFLLLLFLTLIASVSAAGGGGGGGGGSKPASPAPAAPKAPSSPSSPKVPGRNDLPEDEAPDGDTPDDTSPDMIPPPCLTYTIYTNASVWSTEGCGSVWTTGVTSTSLSATGTGRLNSSTALRSATRTAPYAAASTGAAAAVRGVDGGVALIAFVVSGVLFG
ncbi:hypothetical protein EKO04_003298 [Ascochyta lentis]|uniref:Uncharacterized protein n=1 Tax=Ascochyta lentis TaxID=205686 RepID=A0A8H7J902_9PLEO|nr:hypothetical protein EKO04_003298 [Ascochyta lentis]